MGGEAGGAHAESPVLALELATLLTCAGGMRWKLLPYPVVHDPGTSLALVVWAVRRPGSSALIHNLEEEETMRNGQEMSSGGVTSWKVWLTLLAGFTLGLVATSEAL